MGHVVRLCTSLYVCAGGSVLSLHGVGLGGVAFAFGLWAAERTDYCLCVRLFVAVVWASSLTSSIQHSRPNKAVNNTTTVTNTLGKRRRLSSKHMYYVLSIVVVWCCFVCRTLMATTLWAPLLTTSWFLLLMILVW